LPQEEGGEADGEQDEEELSSIGREFLLIAEG
jgi:hypothetical protein